MTHVYISNQPTSGMMTIVIHQGDFSGPYLLNYYYYYPSLITSGDIDVPIYVSCRVVYLCGMFSFVYHHHPSHSHFHPFLL